MECCSPFYKSLLIGKENISNLQKNTPSKGSVIVEVAEAFLCDGQSGMF